MFKNASKIFNCAVSLAGCLFLIASWTCFQMSWYLRLKTALFMVDASVLLNTREETGLPMFIWLVRSLHKTQCWFNCVLCYFSQFFLCHIHNRPPRRRIQWNTGRINVSSKNPWHSFDTTGGVPPQPISNGGVEAPLDSAIHTEPQGRPGPL